ncbi:MAG: hypothetical protein BGP10_13310 [Rhodanobacter sp. 68-29]|nr:hypothetical protein [Rhodanobacter sp.]ODU92222.1 MAG: hypothetical protein ABT18_13160 [Rhodanobacter sp. SCN 66-43]OJY58303.1 MAG: hypothetical protein BGP10_13310 [Rhodanobacter sp. 68-29]
MTHDDLPLHAAVITEDLPELDRLLGLRHSRPHIELDAVDDLGRTALHYASLYRIEGAADRLIRAGASLQIRDRCGSTPIDLFFDGEDDRQLAELSM